MITGNMLFIYFLALAACMLVFFCVGHLTLKIFKKEEESVYLDVFLKLLTGSIIAACSIALYFTGGRTILTGLLIVTFLFLYTYTPYTKNPDSRGNKRIYLIFEMTAVLLLFFFVQGARLAGSGTFGVPHNDYIFYSSVAHHIVANGVENFSLSMNNLVGESSVTPYHYFELWLVGGLGKSLHISEGIILWLIIYPLFLCLSWVGFCALMEQRFGYLFPLHKVIALALIFFSGIYFSFFKSFPLLESIDTFAVSGISAPKYCIFLPVLILFLLSFLHGNISLSVLSLLMFPFVNISAVFSAAGTILFLVINENLKQFLSWKTAKLLLLILVPGIYYVLFYYFFSDKQNGQVDTSLFSFWSISTCVNIIGKTCLQLPILYIPVILIFLMSGQSRILGKHSLFSVVFIFCFSGLAGWALLFPIINSVQFFSNVSVLLLNTLPLFIFIQAEKDGKKNYLAKAFVVAVAATNIFIIVSDSWKNKAIYSNEYIRETMNLSSGLRPAGVFFMGNNELSGLYDLYNSKILGEFLYFYEPSYSSVNLSVFSMLQLKDSLSIQRANIALKTNSFYNFVIAAKNQGAGDSVPHLQEKFIVQNRIEYGFASRTADIPENISRLIKHEIRDVYSGERFFVFN